MTISEEERDHLKRYLAENQSVELVQAYLAYLEKRFHMHPVVYPAEKMIYQSTDAVISHLEKEGKLWRETEIKITYGQQSVNAETKRIYICPFSGKVFGDNTHPNPQDAIYDWVSKCPENTERVGGLKVKRFFVSEDPAMIKSYLEKEKPKAPLAKKVYSSVLSGKLFQTKHAVVEDFKQNYLKPISLFEVQNQNRFEIESGFIELLQKQLVEEKITAFVENLSEWDEFSPYIEQWIETD